MRTAPAGSARGSCRPRTSPSARRWSPSSRRAGRARGRAAPRLLLALLFSLSHSYCLRLLLCHAVLFSSLVSLVSIYVPSRHHGPFTIENNCQRSGVERARGVQPTQRGFLPCRRTSPRPRTSAASAALCTRGARSRRGARHSPQTAFGPRAATAWMSWGACCCTVAQTQSSISKPIETLLQILKSHAHA